jgi:hypothetical protein
MPVRGVPRSSRTQQQCSYCASLPSFLLNSTRYDALGSPLPSASGYTFFSVESHTFALFFGAPQSLRRILRNPSPRIHNTFCSIVQSPPAPRTTTHFQLHSTSGNVPCSSRFVAPDAVHTRVWITVLPHQTICSVWVRLFFVYAVHTSCMQQLNQLMPCLGNHCSLFAAGNVIQAHHALCKLLGAVCRRCCQAITGKKSSISDC